MSNEEMAKGTGGKVEEIVNLMRGLPEAMKDTPGFFGLSDADKAEGLRGAVGSVREQLVAETVREGFNRGSMAGILYAQSFDSEDLERAALCAWAAVLLDPHTYVANLRVAEAIRWVTSNE